MLILHEPFETAWAGRDPFEEVARLQGELFRSVEGRRTFRFEFGGRAYFAKTHAGVGWREIFKNLLTLKAPVLGAGSEYRGIRAFERIGVPTMVVAAFGERGCNPARRESFLITEEIAPAVSLEDFCLRWPVEPPAPRLKWALIDAVADIARELHAHGINHRDFYLCHFLLDTREPPAPDRLRLSMIDLHRVRVRCPLPRRWRLKDLAALYYSAMEIGLTRRDYLRFVRRYDARGLRAALAGDVRLWRQLERRRERLHARQLRHGGAL